MARVQLHEVFVPGGQPGVTYFARLSIRQEQTIANYLQSSGQVLSITGATKSGKTVGVKRVLNDQAIFLSGGSLDSLDTLWRHIGFYLDASTGVHIGLAHTELSDSQASGELSALVAKGGVTRGSGESITRSHDESRELPIGLVVSKLLKERRVPVVIDDFHYIPRAVQTAIVRAIRPLIFEGVPVILLSVPYRGDDAVRAEPELNGRVRHLHVTLWDDHELEAIARTGFKALNVRVPNELVEVFVRQASGSPHLMQEFCLQLCQQNDVPEEQSVTRTIDVPSRSVFFGECASTAFSRVAMDQLIRGPQSRSNRKMRRLREVPSQTMDIYRAVVLALCSFGPKERIGYNEIRTVLRKMLVDADVPQKQEVTRVLAKMYEIAKTAPGDPVIEWDHDDGYLYITDPFFSFLLRFLAGTDGFSDD